MENLNEQQALSPEISSALPVPIPVSKRWYQRKGVIAIGILGLLAFLTCWAYISKQKEASLVVPSTNLKKINSQTQSQKQSYIIYYDVNRTSKGDLKFDFYGNREGKAEKLFSIETASWIFGNDSLTSSWSPDRKKLVLAINYFKEMGLDDNQFTDIVILAEEGGVIKVSDRFTVTGEVLSVMFSPDSGKIVYQQQDVSSEQKSIISDTPPKNGSSYLAMGSTGSSDTVYSSMTELPTIIKERDLKSKSEKILINSVNDILPLAGKNCSHNYMISEDNGKYYFLNSFNSSIHCSLDWYEQGTSLSGLVSIPQKYSIKDNFYSRLYSPGRKIVILYNGKGDLGALNLQNQTLYPINIKYDENLSAISWFDDTSIIYKVIEPERLISDAGELAAKADVVFKKKDLVTGQESEVFRASFIPSLPQNISQTDFKKLYLDATNNDPKTRQGEELSWAYFEAMLQPKTPIIKTGNTKEIFIFQNNEWSSLNIESKKIIPIKMPEGLPLEAEIIGSLD
ncbi:MAG: hypothetical protein WC794_01505 [Candidatus Doudnabacteria bacterium]|jgi:hypothetical protein